MQNFRHDNSNFVPRQFYVSLKGGYTISKITLCHVDSCPDTGPCCMVFSQGAWKRFFGKNRRLFVRNKAVRQLKFVTPDTVERFPQHVVAVLLSGNPWAIDKWRIMPYMLRMPTTENRYRISFTVKFKPRNWSFHNLKNRLSKAGNPCCAIE